MGNHPLAESNASNCQTKGFSPFCLWEDKGPENPSVWLTKVKVISFEPQAQLEHKFLPFKIHLIYKQMLVYIFIGPNTG